MRTADLETVSSDIIESVIMVLSQMTVNMLQEVDQLELFERLARTLIASCTSEDINGLLMHHVRLDMSRFLNNMLK